MGKTLQTGNQHYWPLEQLSSWRQRSTSVKSDAVRRELLSNRVRERNGYRREYSKPRCRFAELLTLKDS